ncbi:OmpA family protein [Algoriphagus halophilus]|nr:OmpA family protein [Algoriphagus halophilus]
MAALLLVFVLILSAILLELEETKEKQNLVITEYKNLKNEIYEKLYEEFKDDLGKWGAELERSNLSFKFNEPDVLFSTNSSVLKTEFKEILSDFFPRYISVLRRDEFIESIEEIRIEGHTSSEWIYNASEDYAYVENMRLSQDRTRSTLNFVLEQITNENARQWTKSLITANGLSSSQLIVNEDGTENKQASRRVEFRVRTDAEKRIDELLKIIDE